MLKYSSPLFLYPYHDFGFSFRSFMLYPSESLYHGFGVMLLLPFPLGPLFLWFVCLFRFMYSFRIYVILSMHCISCSFSISIAGAGFDGSSYFSLAFAIVFSHSSASSFSIYFTPLLTLKDSCLGPSFFHSSVICSLILFLISDHSDFMMFPGLRVFCVFTNSPP